MLVFQFNALHEHFYPKLSHVSQKKSFALGFLFDDEQKRSAREKILTLLKRIIKSRNKLNKTSEIHL